MNELRRGASVPCVLFLLLLTSSYVCTEPEWSAACVSPETEANPVVIKHMKPEELKEYESILDTVKLIHVACFNEEVYEIIHNIKTTDEKDLIVAFYVYKDHDFHYVGSFGANKNIFKAEIGKHNHYFIRNFQHLYIGNGRSWVLDKLIMIPHVKTDIVEFCDDIHCKCEINDFDDDSAKNGVIIVESESNVSGDGLGNNVGAICESDIVENEGNKLGNAYKVDVLSNAKGDGNSVKINQVSAPNTLFNFPCVCENANTASNYYVNPFVNRFLKPNVCPNAYNYRYRNICPYTKLSSILGVKPCKLLSNISPFSFENAVSNKGTVASEINSITKQVRPLDTLQKVYPMTQYTRWYNPYLYNADQKPYINGNKCLRNYNYVTDADNSNVCDKAALMVNENDNNDSKYLINTASNDQASTNNGDKEISSTNIIKEQATATCNEQPNVTDKDNQFQFGISEGTRMDNNENKKGVVSGETQTISNQKPFVVGIGNGVDTSQLGSKSMISNKPQAKSKEFCVNVKQIPVVLNQGNDLQSRYLYNKVNRYETSPSKIIVNNIPTENQVQFTNNILFGYAPNNINLNEKQNYINQNIADVNKFPSGTVETFANLHSQYNKAPVGVTPSNFGHQMNYYFKQPTTQTFKIDEVPIICKTEAKAFEQAAPNFEMRPNQGSTYYAKPASSLKTNENLISLNNFAANYETPKLFGNAVKNVYPKSKLDYLQNPELTNINNLQKIPLNYDNYRASSIFIPNNNNLNMGLTMNGIDKMQIENQPNNEPEIFIDTGTRFTEDKLVPTATTRFSDMHSSINNNGIENNGTKISDNAVIGYGDPKIGEELQQTIGGDKYQNNLVSYNTNLNPGSIEAEAKKLYKQNVYRPDIFAWQGYPTNNNYEIPRNKLQNVYALNNNNIQSPQMNIPNRMSAYFLPNKQIAVSPLKSFQPHLNLPTPNTDMKMIKLNNELVRNDLDPKASTTFGKTAAYNILNNQMSEKTENTNEKSTGRETNDLLNVNNGLKFNSQYDKTENTNKKSTDGETNDLFNVNTGFNPQLMATGVDRPMVSAAPASDYDGSRSLSATYGVPKETENLNTLIPIKNIHVQENVPNYTTNGDHTSLDLEQTNDETGITNEPTDAITNNRIENNDTEIPDKAVIGYGDPKVGEELQQTIGEDKYQNNLIGYNTNLNPGSIEAEAKPNYNQNVYRPDIFAWQGYPTNNNYVIPLNKLQNVYAVNNNKIQSPQIYTTYRMSSYFLPNKQMTVSPLKGFQSHLNLPTLNTDMKMIKLNTGLVKNVLDPKALTTFGKTAACYILNNQMHEKTENTNVQNTDGEKNDLLNVNNGLKFNNEYDKTKNKNIQSPDGVTNDLFNINNGFISEVMATGVDRPMASAAPLSAYDSKESLSATYSDPKETEDLNTLKPINYIPGQGNVPNYVTNDDHASLDIRQTNYETGTPNEPIDPLTFDQEIYAPNVLNQYTAPQQTSGYNDNAQYNTPKEYYGDFDSENNRQEEIFGVSPQFSLNEEVGYNLDNLPTYHDEHKQGNEISFKLPDFNINNDVTNVVQETRYPSYYHQKRDFGEYERQRVEPDINNSDAENMVNFGVLSDNENNIGLENVTPSYAPLTNEINVDNNKPEFSENNYVAFEQNQEKSLYKDKPSVESESLFTTYGKEFEDMSNEQENKNNYLPNESKAGRISDYPDNIKTYSGLQNAILENIGLQNNVAKIMPGTYGNIDQNPYQYEIEKDINKNPTIQTYYSQPEDDTDLNDSVKNLLEKETHDKPAYTNFGPANIIDQTTYSSNELVNPQPYAAEMGTVYKKRVNDVQDDNLEINEEYQSLHSAGINDGNINLGNQIEVTTQQGFQPTMQLVNNNEKLTAIGNQPQMIGEAIMTEQYPLDTINKNNPEVIFNKHKLDKNTNYNDFTTRQLTDMPFETSATGSSNTKAMPDLYSKSEIKYKENQNDLPIKPMDDVTYSVNKVEESPVKSNFTLDTHEFTDKGSLNPFKDTFTPYNKMYNPQMNLKPNLGEAKIISDIKTAPNPDNSITNRENKPLMKHQNDDKNTPTHIGEFESDYIPNTMKNYQENYDKISISEIGDKFRSIYENIEPHRQVSEVSQEVTPITIKKMETKAQKINDVNVTPQIEFNNEWNNIFPLITPNPQNKDTIEEATQNVAREVTNHPPINQKIDIHPCYNSDPVTTEKVNKYYNDYGYEINEGGNYEEFAIANGLIGTKEFNKPRTHYDTSKGYADDNLGMKEGISSIRPESTQPNIQFTSENKANNDNMTPDYGNYEKGYTTADKFQDADKSKHESNTYQKPNLYTSNNEIAPQWSEDIGNIEFDDNYKLQEEIAYGAAPLAMNERLDKYLANNLNQTFLILKNQPNQPNFNTKLAPIKYSPRNENIYCEITPSNNNTIKNNSKEMNKQEDPQAVPLAMNAISDKYDNLGMKEGISSIGPKSTQPNIQFISENKVSNDNMAPDFGNYEEGYKTADKSQDAEESEHEFNLHQKPNLYTSNNEIAPQWSEDNGNGKLMKNTKDTDFDDNYKLQEEISYEVAPPAMNAGLEEYVANNMNPTFSISNNQPNQPFFNRNPAHIEFSSPNENIYSGTTPSNNLVLKNSNEMNKQGKAPKVTTFTMNAGPNDVANNLKPTFLISNNQPNQPNVNINRAQIEILSPNENIYGGTTPSNNSVEKNLNEINKQGKVPEATPLAMTLGLERYVAKNLKPTFSLSNNQPNQPNININRAQIEILSPHENIYGGTIPSDNSIKNNSNEMNKQGKSPEATPFTMNAGPNDDANNLNPTFLISKNQQNQPNFNINPAEIELSAPNENIYSETTLSNNNSIKNNSNEINKQGKSPEATTFTMNAGPNDVANNLNPMFSFFNNQPNQANVNINRAQIEILSPNENIYDGNDPSYNTIPYLKSYSYPLPSNLKDFQSDINSGTYIRIPSSVLQSSVSLDPSKISYSESSNSPPSQLLYGSSAPSRKPLLHSVSSTNTLNPYQFQRSSNQKSLITRPQSITLNALKSNLQNYLKSNENLLNNTEITIPLGDIGVAKYDPIENRKHFTVNTENDDINLKAWYSKLKVMKAKITFETSEADVLNFMPIVSKKSKYCPVKVQEIAKDAISRAYGEPLVIKGVYSFEHPYALVDNLDYSCFYNGSYILLWPTFCGCGCQKAGCQCNLQNLNY